jgi:hypothetical protein
VIEATVRRARPVVLTALAAILAMIPLTRSGFWGSMAVCIMGGLLVATALTLLFLPALYALWFRRSLDAGNANAADGEDPRPVQESEHATVDADVAQASEAGGEPGPQDGRPQLIVEQV